MRVARSYTPCDPSVTHRGLWPSVVRAALLLCLVATIVGALFLHRSSEQTALSILVQSAPVGNVSEAPFTESVDRLDVTGHDQFGSSPR